MGLVIALLRGINVGGTGILPMKELAGLCSGLGFESVRTYIQSGNVVFESGSSEGAIRSCMEKALAVKMGKKIDVVVRTSEEMRLVLSRNPFPDQEGAKVAVAFLGEPPPKYLMRDVIAPGGEQVQRGTREDLRLLSEWDGAVQAKTSFEWSNSNRSEHQHYSEGGRHDRDLNFKVLAGYLAHRLASL